MNLTYNKVTKELTIGTNCLNINEFTALVKAGGLEQFLANENNEIKKAETINETTTDKIKQEQIIFYGVPGCGKSYSIDKHLEELEIIKKDENGNIINNFKSERTKRIVFHPEYTNSDFIGQILPKLKKQQKKDKPEEYDEVITYTFTPGPFTEILIKAYLNKNNNYALIIEEINRGNAAAIFGELFQLLDRFDNDSETVNEYLYGNGWSSYCINNDLIIKEIKKSYCNKDLNKAPYIEQDIIKKYGVNIGIRLPPNLSIFATMNTSDQNVFKLDNAFKRRWDLEMIPNEFDFTCDDEQEQLKQFNQCNAPIEGFDNFTWGAFRAAVNDFIIDPDNGEDINSFSDKQLGTWFVKANESDESETGYIISKKIFMNKVLEYLWDDVFTPEFTIFSSEMKTLAQVIETGNIEVFTDKFVNMVNEKKSIIGQFQIKISEETKETINNNNVFKKPEYKEFLSYIEAFVSHEYADFELNLNNKQFIGVKKKGADNNIDGFNFVFFDIIPTKGIFRYGFIVKKSQEIENSLKINFPDQYSEEVASKTTMRYRIDLKLNDKDYFENKKEILIQYMKQAYEDHYEK